MKGKVVCQYHMVSDVVLGECRRTFCGSSGSSLGCGQSTIFPSGESFKRDATASPNSMHASLLHGDNWQEEERKLDSDALGVKDQPASTFFMVSGQVDLRGTSLRFRNGGLLVEV
jgi:hypothetical protein